METTEKIKIGQIVKSIAGRDSGKKFIIIDILDDKYVLIVDGDLRRLDNPKKKKIKHLMPTKAVLDEIKNKIEAKEKFNNAYVRKLLASFN
ncbi:KOW domain-containing RNA-binding protein [Clostridium sp. D2Q-14]|uniref:KOW domain-containing RNA-binding protein n=1 Tax=Anaeromonas gelatinilytica TaxID=2683194 RepID=UPI00193BC59C|nr:KOW domain-containing RNA-binding protein [Anaeromonas gelatinilytica]MBS4535535.1 KOW domain-containing RNA-binding protein [Anaeromonas gelatinilytica]